MPEESLCMQTSHHGNLKPNISLKLTRNFSFDLICQHVVIYCKSVKISDETKRGRANGKEQLRVVRQDP
jgi:hypothetical protein